MDHSNVNQVDSFWGITLFSIPWIFLILYSCYIFLQHYEFHLNKLFAYSKPLAKNLQQILQSDFKYYQDLDVLDKKKFESRVHHFILNKEFVAEGGLEITDEMRALIAAACVQLGFGLAPIYMAHFKEIIVRPHGIVHGKEIKKKQAILISWEAFTEGFEKANDGYNPGLQSLAIALSLEQQLWGGHHGILGHTPFKRWRQKSRLAAGNLIKTGMTRFSHMKEVDENEYFAAAVVYFFEQPDIFKQKFPELFQELEIFTEARSREKEEQKIKCGMIFLNELLVKFFLK